MYRKMSNIIKSTHTLQKEKNLSSFINLEKKLGFTITEEVKEILLEYNVAKPERTYYKKENIEFRLNYFFGFSEHKHEDFYDTYNNYLGRIPDELYPIASVDGGDLLLVSKIDESIYFWFHEEDDWGIENITKWPTKVCNDIKEFLNLLTLPNLPTKEEIQESLKNSNITITPAFVKIKNDIRAKEGLLALTLEEWEKELNS